MPLYEYECEACHQRFEKIRKFSDPPLDECPSCGSGPVRKLMSSPAIQFKGTGWYITDYAKKSGADAGKAGSAKSEGSDKSESKSDSPSDSKSDGKSETKPDSKSDSGSSSSDKAGASTVKSE